jgi:hypothetical protein
MVGAGSAHMLRLHRGGLSMSIPCRNLIRRRRAGMNPTIAAVVADMIDRGVVNYGLVVDMNIRHVHIYIVYRTVVVEGAIVPISTLVSDTTISVAVIDATIEADVRPPVAGIPSVGAAAPAPVPWSPEQANGGSHHPRAWHPEVALVTIGPVAGRPQITAIRRHGLYVYGQRGRSDHDGNGELPERGRRYSKYQKC